MTVATLPPDTARTTAPSVSAMAWFEAKRLIRHPAFLLLGGLTVITLFLGDPGGRPNDAYLGLTSYGFIMLAIGTLVACQRVATRSRREGVQELADTMPTGRRARTAAHLLAVLAPVVVAVAVLAVAMVYIAGAGGPLVALETGVVRKWPSAIELLQGPVLVAFCGVLGVTLARWAPSRTLLLLAAFLLYFLATNSFWWHLWEAGDWFMPAVSHEIVVREGFGPGAHDVLGGFHAGSLGWHVAYLGGLTGTLAAAALGRDGLSRRLVAALGVSGAVVVVAGLLQIP